jgi:hypothetical protein
MHHKKRKPARLPFFVMCAMSMSQDNRVSSHRRLYEVKIIHFYRFKKIAFGSFS